MAADPRHFGRGSGVMARPPQPRRPVPSKRTAGAPLLPRRRHRAGRRRGEGWGDPVTTKAEGPARAESAATLVAEIVFAKLAEQAGERRPVTVVRLLQRLCPDPARRIEAIAMLLGGDVESLRRAGEGLVRAGRKAP